VISAVRFPPFDFCREISAVRFLPCDFCREISAVHSLPTAVAPHPSVSYAVGKAPVRPAHGVHSSCDPAWRGAALFVRRADSDGRVQFYSFKDTEKPCFSVFYAYI